MGIWFCMNRYSSFNDIGASDERNLGLNSSFWYSLAKLIEEHVIVTGGADAIGVYAGSNRFKYISSYTGLETEQSSAKMGELDTRDEVKFKLLLSTISNLEC